MEFIHVVSMYKRYVEPFIAIFVLIGLAYTCFMLYENHQAKKDIARECGWAEDDVRCWCKKSDVIASENLIRGEVGEFGEVLFNVSLAK